MMRWITILALGLMSAMAAEQGWDADLARAFSPRMRTIDDEISRIQSRLVDLPVIPLADQGGTGGWAGVFASARAAEGSSHALEIRWASPASPDCVVLVPARRYDARGLDAQYGLPDAFTVELIDASGATVKRVAAEIDTRAHPVRRGHPWLYRISEPVEASGLRVVADRLSPDFEERESFVHAWSEVMVFVGEHEISRGAETRVIGGALPPAPWHWSPRYLTDGQTPLGLPELPAGEHRNVGWLSEGRASADEAAGVTIDLKQPYRLEALRLLPARRPTPDLPSGFGFPEKIKVSSSDSGLPGSWRVIFEGELRNPGHNPVRLELQATDARYLQVEATRLWKAFSEYPAFFALSEIEVISNKRNVALGAVVRSSAGMQNLIAPGGRFWTTTALVDGFGPDGKLVSPREWLERIDERLQLETQMHGLQIESASIVAGWRKWVLGSALGLGVAGLLAMIALPVRFRIHSRRELHRVRERIAGDLHDEVGSNLGSIQMLADLAEGRSGPSQELKRIQRIAAETVSAVRDIVWLLRSEGDHRIATVEHLRETASIMLESLDWKFTASDSGWQVQLSESSNRDLFLYFREALHNILRHSDARSVRIHVEERDGEFHLSIEDNGCGIPTEKLQRPATLRSLRQRADAMNAKFECISHPGEGTKLNLRMSLARMRS
ncbi:MAG: histidine kinase [Luteolibacter sp.]